MIDYVTGANGFLGSKLFKKLPENKVGIPHPHLSRQLWFDQPCRFFFLGAYGNMAHQKSVPEMVKANVIEPWELLRAALPRFFVYVSSSSVNLPVQTPYSRTKQAAELILRSLPDNCIVRPYSVTGVGEQKEHLIPTLIRSCLDGEPMDFVPDATHDFVDVEDVVNGLLFLSEKRLTGIFELGSGKSVTNDEVRHLVETVCGRPANIREVKQLRAYDTPDWCCRDDTARKIGWEPHKRLVTSIREMVEVYRK